MGRGYSLCGIRRCNGVNSIWGWWWVNGESKVFCNWGRGWYTSWRGMGKRVGYFFPWW